MLADIGTKPLGSSRLLELMLGLGLHVPVHSPPTVASAINLLPQPILVSGSPRAEGNNPRIQRLIRALVLLELIEFLPLTEASDVMVVSDQLWSLAELCSALPGPVELVVPPWEPDPHVGFSLDVGSSVPPPVLIGAW